MMTKLFIVDYINLYIIFRVKNIIFTQKCNTGGALQKTRLYFTQITPLSVLNFYIFTLKRIFAHLVVISCGSRGDLVRISLNFSTFNILIFTAVSGKKNRTNPSIKCLQLFWGICAVFLTTHSLLQTTKRRPFLIINIICLFNAIFHTIIYNGFTIYNFLHLIYHGFRKRAWHAPTSDIRPTSVVHVTHSRHTPGTRLHLTQYRQVASN